MTEFVDTGRHLTVVEKQPKEETPPSVRHIAREQGIKLGRLISILQHQRQAGSKTEKIFVENFLDHYADMQIDDYGNRFIIVGEDPKILWSCHTDTVCRHEGMQNVKWEGDSLVLNNPKQGQCLGADDGAGLWLLLEMLEAGKEGLYIFHREEEIGGLGSKHIAAKNPDLVKGIEMAIAFDRRATHSVITHQRGGRCCSDKFADAMIEKLGQIDGLNYKKDTGGSFTDTASYIKLVSECTNISVGYDHEHSDYEELDVAHLLRLREALLTVDFSDLPIARDPTVTEYASYNGWANYSSGRTPYKPRHLMTNLERLEEICRDRPTTMAKWFESMAVDADDLEARLNEVWGFPPRQSSANDDYDSEVAAYLEAQEQQDDNIVETLFCDDCGDFCAPEDLMRPRPWPGDECPVCLGRNTDLYEVELDPETGEIMANG